MSAPGRDDIYMCFKDSEIRAELHPRSTNTRSSSCLLSAIFGDVIGPFQEAFFKSVRDQFASFVHNMRVFQAEESYAKLVMIATDYINASASRRDNESFENHVSRIKQEVCVKIRGNCILGLHTFMVFYKESMVQSKDEYKKTNLIFFSFPTPKATGRCYVVSELSYQRNDNKKTIYIANTPDSHFFLIQPVKKERAFMEDVVKDRKHILVPHNSRFGQAASKRPRPSPAQEQEERAVQEAITASLQTVTVEERMVQQAVQDSMQSEPWSQETLVLSDEEEPVKPACEPGPVKPACEPGPVKPVCEPGLVKPACEPVPMRRQFSVYQPAPVSRPTPPAPESRPTPPAPPRRVTIFRLESIVSVPYNPKKR